jgi:hypothetical protein
MRIIQSGKLPDAETYNGQCDRCNAIIECDLVADKYDIIKKEYPSNNDGTVTFYYTKCPTANCSSMIRLFPGKHFKPSEDFNKAVLKLLHKLS